MRAVTPDTIAKFLFTSGSTGMPKAVITTQRMLTCNQEMIRTALAFLADGPPVLVDWMPWNHIAGGSHNLGIALYNGGTLLRSTTALPTPDGIERTVRNLEEVSPTVYFNVPKGYEMLVAASRDQPAPARQLLQPAQGHAVCRAPASASTSGTASTAPRSAPPASAS